MNYRMSALLAVAMATGLATAWAGQSVNETATVTADGLVEIENVDGSVVVEGWTENRVEVTGTLWKGARGLEFNSHGDRTHIEVELPHNTREVEGSHLTVRVPARCRLEIDTVSASIEVSGVSGNMSLESVSGDIHVAGRSAGVDAESVSGRVELEDVSDRADVETVSGDIDVLKAGGSLELASVSGNISVRDGTLDRLSGETTSGWIRIAAEPSARATVTLETMSGGVELSVPASLAADYDLSTFSGSITNQIGPAAESTSRYTPGKKASFSTGSGGARISLTSFSGSVKLLAR